jgi:FAD-dependent urate hydroxylase
MSTVRTALVIGGGIAGPVTAMALCRAGIDARIREAYPGPADGVGGGLSIAPNGINALAAIGAGHVVRDLGEPMPGIVLESWTGKKLARFGGDGTDGLPVPRFLWRTDLYRALHEEATARGVPMEYGHRLVGLETGPDRVVARFADGSEETADILVGADGIHSTVRTLIDPRAPRPRYTGLVSVAGTFDGGGLPSTRGDMVMSFGRQAFFGYLVRDDGSGGWFVNLPSPEPMTTETMRSIPVETWLARMRDVFAADRTAAPALLAATDASDLLVVGPMEDLPRVPSWHHGRVVLIGDAAHAPSSSSGQGASVAIESAVELGRCLRDLDYDQAFPAFEALRRGRVERIIAAGARTNRNKAAGPVARVLRDALLPVTMRLLAKPERMAWQFAHRIDWDAPVTAT